MLLVLFELITEDCPQRLAGEIPSLQQTDPNRLSKHVVLDESTSLHRTQKSEITTSLSQINALLAERDDLLAEVNRWRLGAGVESRQPMNAAMPLPSPQPIRPPSPSNDHDIEDGFTESPPLLHQVASDTVDVNLGSLGPSSTAVANAGHGILASNGADAWDGLAMGLNMAEPPIDLDGMNVDTLVSGPYELPFLRHNGSDNYGMPFQSHHSQILEPSAFLQEDHIRNV